MQNVSEDIVAVVWGVVEELIDGGQLLGGAVDLSVPIQGEQPADVFEGSTIVSWDEHPRGGAFTDFLETPKLIFCSCQYVDILHNCYLVSSQAEDNGGALTGPVDHQVQVRVIQMKHRTRKGWFSYSGSKHGIEVPDVLLNCIHIYISLHSLNLIHLFSIYEPD